MATVAVIGSFNIDHVWRCQSLPSIGATISGEYSTGPGGKGFNQAIAAVKAGTPTRFLCALGDDSGGHLADTLARAEGLDLHASLQDLPTGTAGIYVDSRGRNSIVIGAGANAALTEDSINRHGHLIADASVTLTQLESPPHAIRAALRLASQAGSRTILNPAPANVMPERELLCNSDVLTPNETEFSALLATHCRQRIAPDQVVQTDDDTLHRLCRQLHSHGSIIITLGANGVFVSHAEDRLFEDISPHYRLAAERVTAVDTTGAGDAFNGAFAAAWARAPQTAFCDHVRFANRFAGMATEHTGAATAMPSRDAVMTRFGD